MRRAGPLLGLLLLGALVVLALRDDAPSPSERPEASAETLTPLPTDGVELDGTRPPGSADPADLDPVAGEATTEAGPQNAAGPTLDLDPVREVISLGPARGLVRDARSHQPIAGAWLTWRPPTGEALALVFNDPQFRGLVGERAFGMLSDANGRFAVERLADDMPPEPVLFAVARGHAVSAVRPGVGVELVIDMEPGGGLRVVGGRGALAAAPRLTFLGQDPSYQAYLDRSSPEPTGGALVFSHLRPGRYTLARGPTAVEARVEVGRVTEVVWPEPDWIRVAGVLQGYDEHAGWLECARLDGDWGREVALGPGGEFALEAPPGAYALRWIDPHTGSEVTLARVAEDSAGLELGLPEGFELEFEALVDGEPPREAIGLAEATPVGDRHSAQRREGDPWQHVSHARPGRYWVFMAEAYLGEVELAAGQRPRLVLEPWDQRLRLRLPPLPEGEALRAQVNLVPEALAADPGLAERLGDPRIAPPPRLLRGELAEVTLRVYRPGRYRLTVRSDLGALERTLELVRDGAPVELDLR